jgi:hypothetical protein
LCTRELNEGKRDQGRGAHGEGQGARGARAKARPSWAAGLSRAALRDKNPRHTQPQIEIQSRNEIQNENKQHTRLNTTSNKEICLGMMQHSCQLRFLFTRIVDTSRYTALKLGRWSETEEKRE